MAEEALRSSAEQYHSTIDSIADPIHVINRDYQIGLVNRALLKWHEKIGIDTDLIGRNLFELYTFLPEGVKDEYEKVFESGQTLITREESNISGRVIITESRKIPIVKNGEVTRIVTVLRDISISVRAEEHLRQREALLRATIDSLPFDFFALDESGRYILQNRVCTENWGTLIGHRPEEMAPNEKIRDIWLSNNARVLAGETVDEETVYSRGDDRQHIHNITAPINDGDRAIGILGINMDISKRKQAEKSLRESEEKYSRLFHGSSDAIFIHDLEGRIIDVNKKVLELFGCTREEIIEGNIAELHPQEMYDVSLQAFKTVMREGYVQFEVTFQKKNKEEFQAEVSSSLIELSGSRVVQGIVRDVTERKRSEEALKESEEKFRLAFKTSPDTINISRVEDGVFIQVNDGFQTMTGYSEDEVVGKSSIDLNLWYNPDDRQDMIEGLKRDGYVTNLEKKFRTKDGSLKIVLLSARIIRLKGIPHILTITRDISDMKKAEAALRQSEERLRAIFETARDAIFIKNREFKYVTANPSMERLFGIPVSEMIGKDNHEIFGDDASERMLQIDQRVLDGDIVNEEYIDTFRGEERIFDIVEVPMRDSRGNIIGLCGIARDVTDTRRLQDFAARAQRLETAGRIAGQVAHDFNNLLGPLVAFPELIKDEIAGNKRVYKYVDAMEKAAQKIADINQQLLTLGRRAHYEQAPLNLNEIIREVLGQLPPPNENIKTVTGLDENLMNIIGGAAQIHRVIANLIVNAFDAMENGGELTVVSENYYLDDSAGDYEPIPKGEYVKLTISDTGQGIPLEILGKIFDPFFTTKATDKRRGSGLGLSVVHAVMEDHHGFIDCHSEPGWGASFYLYFPITRQGIEKEPVKQICGGSETIMVVDDDTDQRDVSAKLLTKLGYKVLTAENGEDAVEKVRQSPVDLVLLDMIMPPGIDGAETYKRIMAFKPDQKAIIVSGYARSERAKLALELGARGFLRKPLTMKSMALSIRKALDTVPTGAVSP